MNELLHFFTKGLIITFLIVLGLSLLGRIKKIIIKLFALWMILAILTFFILPLIAIIWAIVYVGKG